MNKEAFLNHSGSQEVPQIPLQACQCDLLEPYGRPYIYHYVTPWE